MIRVAKIFSALVIVAFIVFAIVIDEGRRRCVDAYGRPGVAVRYANFRCQVAQEQAWTDTKRP